MSPGAQEEPPRQGSWARARQLAFPKEPRSLFSEILDWMLAPLLLLWPLSVAITYGVAQAISNAPFDRDLGDATILLAQHLKTAPTSKTVLSYPPFSVHLDTDKTSHVQYQIADQRGELLDGTAELPLPPPEEMALDKVYLRNASIRGQDLRLAHMWTTAPAWVPDGFVLIQTAETLDRRKQLAGEIIKSVIIPQFAILPVAVLLVWFGLSRGISPLRELRARLRARQPDDLSPVEPHDVPEEMVPVIVAFNDLLQRLDQSIGTQKRFVADAAHQMKTPLAGLRMQAELALRHTDSEEAGRSLRHIILSTERTAHLVNQLLSLARAENANEAAQLVTRLDLRDVARNQAQEWVPIALKQDVDLGFETWARPVYAEGQIILLNEMIGNLLDNALRYSHAKGHVTVRVYTDPETWEGVLEVEDNGPGIPVSERSLVFERFYRALGTGVEGSGLGLAIVREIAQQHGANVSLNHNPYALDPEHAPGTLVTVRFPPISPGPARI